MQELAKYTTDAGEEITVTAQDVRETLCKSATPQEISMFLALCQAQKLNPFIKDAYLVKYGNGPASIITSKDAFMKRAYAHPKFQGMEAGITVLANGQITRREGSAVFAAAGEQLVGGWARVFVEGRKPSFDEVALSEYGTGKSMWAKMPATMIRKVAIVHAIREAFPDQFQGLYTAEEMQQAGGGDYEPPEPSIEWPSEREQPAPVAPVDPEVTDERAQELLDLIETFGSLCGKSTAEAMSAVYSSRAAQAVHAEAGRILTESQADALEELLHSWIQKAEARETAKPAPEVQAVGEALNATFEPVEDGGDYGEQPTEQPALYDEDVKF